MRIEAGLVCVVLAAAMLAPGVARAAPRCPVHEELSMGPGFTDDDGRRQWLQTRLDYAAHRSRAWSLGWGVSLGLLSAGQLVIAPLSPTEERPDWWVGAGAAGVGVLTRVVFLPRVFGERRRLKRSTATGCARTAELEAAVLASAKWERSGRSLLMHGLSLGFNAGAGLLLGLAFDRPVAGNRLAAMGMVIGEIMIITQPQAMMRTVDAYGRARVVPTRPLVGPFVTPGGGGLSLRGRI